MRTSRFTLATMLAIFESGCQSSDTLKSQLVSSAPAQRLVTQSPRAAPTSIPIVQDDLMWLVGRWRCISRQYFTKQEQLMAATGDSLLDYFNVYLPYADERLTVNVTGNPDDRPIAAEFLVRHVY